MVFSITGLVLDRINCCYFCPQNSLVSKDWLESHKRVSSFILNESAKLLSFTPSQSSEQHVYSISIDFHFDLQKNDDSRVRIMKIFALIARSLNISISDSITDFETNISIYYEHFENDILTISKLISNIEQPIVNLTSIESLYLKLGILTEKFFEQFSAKKQLLLQNSDLYHIPPAVRKFQNLSELDFAHNNIEKIPNELCDFPNLQLLGLRHNKIRVIPENIRNLIHLKSLYLSSNKIQQISIALTKLQSLEELDLSNNEIEIIPDNFNQLQSLKYLFLSRNKIKKIPQALAALKGLLCLNLARNQIEIFPYELAELGQLEEFKIHKNNFQTIPTEFIEIMDSRNIDFKA